MIIPLLLFQYWHSKMPIFRRAYIFVHYYYRICTLWAWLSAFSKWKFLPAVARQAHWLRVIHCTYYYFTLRHASKSNASPQGQTSLAIHSTTTWPMDFSMPVKISLPLNTFVKAKAALAVLVYFLVIIYPQYA